MNQEDIIRMARECGLIGMRPHLDGIYQEALERFAILVAAAEAEKYKWDIHSCGPTCTKVACVAMREAVEAEREACAKFCDEQQELVGAEMCCVAMNCADAIRARGKREAD